MDKRYEVHCLADRHFYETPDRLDSSRDDALFEPARRAAPGGWRTARSGDWLHLIPGLEQTGGRQLPSQGWKIHVSATADSAEKTAAAVWDYCIPRGISFKFVPSRPLLHLRNSKYAARDASGKFVTVYPRDEQELHTVLTELHEIVGGRPGPYILTDLRWHEGPLYVRYGAFERRYCLDGRGALVHAVEDGTGRLVPDSRNPAFQVPSWVTLPAFLEPHLAARNATTVGELPYRIEKALHFSNGGGVYRGTDLRDGRAVVLKEGRPHAGLAADGADAIARLEREKAALERLSGLGVAPAVRDWCTLGDHRFLVMDFVEGRTLNSYFAERHPLLATDPDPAALAAYTAWALRIHRAVEEAVEAVHGRGVVFNDLHMFNIMVAPDERSVVLIDFEAAADVSDRTRQVVAHPGFCAPPGRTGTSTDRYALACLRLALFLPITTLLAVDRGKAAHLADVIAAEFPDVPREFLDEAVDEITREEGGTRRRQQPLPEPGDWPRSRDSMVRALLASATPDRDDRLFPGDIAQFTEGGGLGLAHGAAGVLHALAETGAPRYETGEQWLLDHTDPAPPGTPPGLYDGLAGAAFVLDRLGHRDRALDLVATVLGERWQRLGSGLHGGLAGIGLVLDHFGRVTGERDFHERAVEAAQLLADRMAAPAAPGPGRAGLLHGATGPALFFLRLYERTGAPDLLDLAGAALRADLERCVRTARGALAVDEGWRTLPYLGDGSVGIGAVLDDYLGHVPGSDLAEARSGILAAARSRFYAQPGLFQGRAGMIWHLARTTAPGAAPDHLARQIAALGWYSMVHQGELAFPGHQMMRLSMDLATGTAGCLLALGSALGDRTAQLPFLPRPHGRP
ncbi:class III lanthionine synthetase LanKC [Streptomyces morookaense]|uniref:Protein kinase/lanthionine synthetase C family protein n=1 Tax=Streptomyces morookaense TaxID=1970 RepID=A0A7Y7B446_STRMO|nr:class III lanthionine synthetase LanKC [Streptomyces morookaense]NVK78597.1 protein kinase/lanthionine synthetase C family protein [Streptomyces morookaense]GHF33675.1 serine/threonine protein kinase [Streptomyces morookaense]